jgi:hypothetical protein
MRARARRRPAWAAIVVAVIAAGCSTNSMHPDLVARASKVRVVSDPEAVRGCTFLRSVTAREEPGFTTSRGLVLDPGVPAMTLLQAYAQIAGADTLEVANTERAYTAAANQNVGRARTLTTLTGNAYQCSQAVSQASLPTENKPEPGPSADRLQENLGGWGPQNWEREGSKMVGILQSAAPDFKPLLFFGCLSDAARTRLAAALFTKQALRREANGNSTVQVRLDSQPATPISLFLSANEVRYGELYTAEFYEADVVQFKNDWRMHDKMLVQVWLRDGSSDVLEFDLRGFSDASRTAIAGCNVR